MGANPATFQGDKVKDDRHPVETITWATGSGLHQEAELVGKNQADPAADRVRMGVRRKSRRSGVNSLAGNTRTSRDQQPRPQWWQWTSSAPADHRNGRHEETAKRPGRSTF